MIGNFRKLIVLAAGALAANGVLAQQPWPNRPIHILVGYPGGTAPDSFARLGGTEAGKRLGQPTVVENRPGAGGRLADSAVARATPDGYTLMVTGTPIRVWAVFTGMTVVPNVRTGRNAARLAASCRTRATLSARSWTRAWRSVRSI